MSARDALRATLAGVGAAAAGSLVVAAGAALFAGDFQGALPWLFLVSVVPAVLVSLGAAAFVQGREPSRKRVWAVAVVSAFAAVALAGSAGAIALQSVRFGYERVNASGYLAWCGVYAAVLLPLTAPIARVALRLSWRPRR